MANHQTLAFSLLCVLSFTLPAVAQRRGGGRDGSPPPTPDVVYCNGKVTSGSRPLSVMSANGGNARQVLGEDCKYAYPSLSPDGRQIAFAKTRNGVSAVWVVDVDGTGLRAVTPILLPIGSQLGGTFPRTRVVWSPAPAPDQQRKLLFADTPDPSSVPWQLFTVDLDGSSRTQLTQDPAGIGPFACYEWSADATRIAYVNHVAQSPLFVANLGVVGGQLAITGQLLVPPPGGENGIRDIGWANTGDQLVLAVATPLAQGGNNDLWLVDLAYPMAPVRLTATAEHEMMPTFSSDDSRIFFWNYSGAGGTYTIPTNGSGSRVLVNSKAQSPYHRRG